VLSFLFERTVRKSKQRVFLFYELLNRNTKKKFLRRRNKKCREKKRLKKKKTSNRLKFFSRVGI
jgi:hypothetical protein